MQLKCPNDIVAFVTPGNCTSLILFEYPYVSTLCGDVPVVQLSGLPSGSEFPVGDNYIEFKAIFGDGNTQICSMLVKVRDTITPILICPSDTVLFVNDVNSKVEYTYSRPVYSDNCSGVKLCLVSGPSITNEYSLGVIPIFYQAEDKSRNISQCHFRVHVEVDTHFIMSTNRPDNHSQNIPIGNSNVDISSIEADSVVYYPDLDLQSCMVTAFFYDNNDPDQDSISVYFDGKEIISKSMIKRKEDGPLVHAFLLEKGEARCLTVKAWNLGKISPNTLRADFYYGYHVSDVNRIIRKKPNFSRNFHCKPGISGALYLKCSSN